MAEDKSDERHYRKKRCEDRIQSFFVEGARKGTDEKVYRKMKKKRGKIKKNNNNNHSKAIRRNKVGYVAQRT